MPSGNLDEPVTATPPPAAAPPSAFRFPCAYYSAPLSEVRPIFPKWVPAGCGIASAVIIVLLFAGGALLSGPALSQFMDFVLGLSLGEMRGMYTPEVTAQQKQHFDDEVIHLRDGLRNNTVPMSNVQPFLKTVQTAIADGKVTPEEVDRLARAAEDATASKPPEAKKHR
ncbi:MAG: hypothetical protein ACXW29_11615 [Thermoanaerobaculia bacterium]